MCVKAGRHPNPGVAARLDDLRSFDQVVKDHLATCPGATEPDVKSVKHLERLRFLLVALAGEAGEALNYIKKEWRGDTNIREDYEAWELKLEEEIVDCANYVCMLAAHMDIHLKERQLAKYCKVEERPDWDVWSKRSDAGNTAEPHQRDDIHIEFNRKARAHVSAQPLGTVCERVRQATERAAELHKDASVTGYRTSKETIDLLSYFAGVCPRIENRHHFMGHIIRAWGDYS